MTTPPTIRADCADQELSAAVALHVAKLGEVETHWGDGQCNAIYMWRHPSDAPSWERPWSDLPPYATSADAVLPLLEARGWKGCSNRRGGTSAATVFVACLNSPSGEVFSVCCDTAHDFERAACLALLKAHGVTVIEP